MSDSIDFCKHELIIGTCSICKFEGKPDVYITGGGTRFHLTPDCEALKDGQEQVRARGGSPEKIERVIRGSAKLLDRDPCRTCNPE